MAKKILITGSSGLIGSEIALLFDGAGYRVFGVDNNSRERFFGPDGDTRWNLARLKAKTSAFTHIDMDIRDATGMERLVRDVRPDCVVHCAAQPAHEYARRFPAVDFQVNVTGTMSLLEVCRMHTPDAVLVFCSSSKVYGPVNDIPFVETPTRFDLVGQAPRLSIDRQDARLPKTGIGGADSNPPAKVHGRAPLQGWSFNGITEEFPIEPGDGRGIYGTGKAAADLMVQQYGITYGMRTVCLRGNCMTGPGHSPAEIHGFLAYLARSLVQGREYTVIGFRGKQVRDNIHSFDYATAVFALCTAPPAPGTVYNIGGGRGNSVSLLEAISLMEQVSGKRLKINFADFPREGDHRVYISDMSKFRKDYPEWELKWPIEQICEDLVRSAEALHA
ncbi:MAG: NAD-dependent epimerase/dehydratase family protein [Desulfomonile sp.]|nr:NAD-dependent epimerase/dehydratase family protein [Desulfomonile sp.]